MTPWWNSVIKSHEKVKNKIATLLQSTEKLFPRYRPWMKLFADLHTWKILLECHFCFLQWAGKLMYREQLYKYQHQPHFMAQRCSSTSHFSKLSSHFSRQKKNMKSPQFLITFTIFSQPIFLEICLANCFEHTPASNATVPVTFGITSLGWKYVIGNPGYTAHHNRRSMILRQGFSVLKS